MNTSAHDLDLLTSLIYFMYFRFIRVSDRILMKTIFALKTATNNYLKHYKSPEENIQSETRVEHQNMQ